MDKQVREVERLREVLRQIEYAESVEHARCAARVALRNSPPTNGGEKP